MTTTIQIEEIGDRFVLPLSREMLENLGISEAGEIEATDFDERIELGNSQNCSERQRQFKKLTDDIFDEYKELFAALAEGAK